MENENFTSSENLSLNPVQNENEDSQPIVQNSFNNGESSSIPKIAEETENSLSQLEEERKLRQKYEDAIFEMSEKELNPQNLQAHFDYLLKNKGEAYANQWLDNKLKNLSAVQTENQSVLRNVQTKYQELYAVPEVKQAIEAYLQMDMNQNESLKEQGFEDAVEYISSIYKAGYNAALKMKAENNNAKSRLQSSVNCGVPSSNTARAFTRAEIAAMDTETFSKYEKVIFDQMAKGLIK